MQNTWSLLIVSGCLENRREILRILDSLPVNVLIAHNLNDAMEALGKQRTEMVLCDSFLPDGTYRELLANLELANIPTVIMTHAWDREIQSDAILRGAFDTLRCPLQPTDVELLVIRAARERYHVELLQTETYRMIA